MLASRPTSSAVARRDHVGRGCKPLPLRTWLRSDRERHAWRWRAKLDRSTVFREVWRVADGEAEGVGGVGGGAGSLEER